MRKALIPMLASLALCGAGTLALIASNERALAGPRKPIMVTLLSADALLTQNLPDASPASDMGEAPGFGPNLKQLCADHYASEVGRMAYLEARLQLSDSEQPLFAHWKEVRLDIAKHREADCNARIATPDQGHADPVERMSREETLLKQRIADLDTERPVFAALYAVLTPEQRAALEPERSFRGRAPRPSGMDAPPQPPPPPPAP